MFEAGRLGPVRKSNNSGGWVDSSESRGGVTQALEFVTGKWKSEFVIHIIFN